MLIVNNLTHVSPKGSRKTEKNFAREGRSHASSFKQFSHPSSNEGFASLSHVINLYFASCFRVRRRVAVLSCHAIGAACSPVFLALEEPAGIKGEACSMFLTKNAGACALNEIPQSIGVTGKISIIYDCPAQNALYIR
ncbi:hypothetical protein JXA32_04655 [Candidatus Sumerlaeota bacterium]|nr:hypothetical protein [Candidatus Sumerlaeota bacterium]